MTAWLSLAISLVAVAIAVIVTRRMVDRRTGSAAVMDEIRREVGSILTEMNQTTERNIELLEDRVTRLKEVVDQADRRLGTLRRETQKQENAEMVYSHLGRVARPAAGRASGGSPPLEQRPGESTLAEGADQPPVNDRAQSNGNAQPIDETEGEPDNRTEPPLKDRALGLYRQGISVDRIASRLKTTVSEIELIVSLGER